MVRGPLSGASGPGKFSKRTDLPSTYYGEGVETNAINTAAPKSKTRGIADDVGGRPTSALTPVVPLYAPTQYPNTPITEGIKIGDGADEKALMMKSQFAGRKTSDILADLIPFDETGEVAILYQQALSRGQ